MLKLILTINLSVILFFSFASPGAAQELKSDQADIYFNEACGMCAKYVHDALPAMLEKQGINRFIEKDYINDKNNRVEMNKVMDTLEVPLALQSHIMTFVGDKYILGGHIPEHIIQDIFNSENNQKFKRIIIFQDEMHDDVENYQVLAIPEYTDVYVGEIQTYSIDTHITEYLDYLEKNKDQFKNINVNNETNKQPGLLPVIIASGFLDGLNPCAFAVLLFFIAFLFSLKRTKASIWKMGIVYISAIFLAYMLIGFGIMKAILFSNSPHFMAQLGAWLVIVLGIINLINHFFPKFPIKLRIPTASKGTLQKWMYKATLPAAFVLGFLVGLCTFPCSGGIYVAIIGLLASETTYMSGVGYLFVYNVMFIMPLVIILLLSSNKYSVDKITKLEQSKSKVMKLFSALVMIALGVIILIWFT